MVLGSFCYICNSAALCNGARGEICCAWSATCCFCYQYTPTSVAKTVRKEADIQWRHKSTGGHMLGLESIRPNNKVSEAIRKAPARGIEAQTALGKQKKIRSVERRYLSVPVPKFCEKLLLHAKFHWNRTIGCWLMAENNFQYGGRPPFWILGVQNGFFESLLW